MGAKPESVSLRQAVTAYLEEMAHVRTENVYQNHVSLSKRFLGYFSAARPINQVAKLSRPDLLAFLEWLTHKRGSFTPSTFNMGVEFLRRLGRFCAARGWTEQPLAADIPFHVIAVEPPPVLSRIEMASLLEMSRSDDFKRLLIGLLGEMGLKKQELVGLKLADLELDVPNPEIIVRYSGKLQSKTRRLRVPAQLAAAMRRYVERRKAEGTYNFLQPLVPITGRQVNNIIADLCQEAGVRRANPQILRDTAAAHLLMDGWSPEDVSRQLGYTARGYLLEFLPRFQLWIEAPLPPSPL